MLLTTIGKKLRRNTSSNLGVKPKPNQMMKSGAIAILGTIWRNTIKGRSWRSNEARVGDQQRERDADRDREQIARTISEVVTQAPSSTRGQRLDRSTMILEGGGSR